MENFLKNYPKVEQGENKIEKHQIKEGVEFVFAQHPELIEVGTKEQYSKYLNTIFPDSIIKEIVFHGTDKVFEEFDDKYLGSKDNGYYGKGFYFWVGKNALEGAEQLVFSYTNSQPESINIKAAVVDIQKPKETRQLDFNDTGMDFEEFDGAIIKSQLVVKSSQQIHVLGSKIDIEKFKNFVKTVAID